MNRLSIKQTFLLSLTILILCIIIDAFMFEGNLLTKILGILLSGHLGFVIYRHEKQLWSSFLIGGFLGFLLELFFYLLVALDYIPVPEKLQLIFNDHSQIWRFFVFFVASLITGLLYSFYSLIGASGAKLFWKPKTRIQK